jgi:NADH dehydrogenase
MNTSHENRKRTSRARLPHVVIIGGGFGGLYAARELARAPVTVTLIDKRNYHLFRPMLYQVATGLLSSDEVAAPIRSILRRQKNVTVLLAEVVGVDPHARVVTISFLQPVSSTTTSVTRSGRLTRRGLLPWTTPIASEARSSRLLNRPKSSRRAGRRTHRFASC